MPPLTAEEQKSYYATQGNAAKPLSPLAYAATIRKEQTAPVSSLNTATAAENVQKDVAKLDTSIANRGVTPEKPAGTLPTTETKPTSTATFLDANGAEVTNPTYEQVRDNKLTFSGGEMPSWYNADPQARALEAKSAANSKILDDAIASLDTFKAQNATLYATQIQNIQNQFAIRKKQMEDINMRRVGAINTSGVRSGSERYTQSFGSIVTEEEKQGIDRLAELDTQKAQAEAEAKAAQVKGDWEIFDKKMSLIDKQQTDIQAKIKELNDKTIENNKAIALKKKEARDAEAKKQEQLTKDINGVLGDAAKNGLSDPATLTKIQNAGSVGEAMMYAGNYLQSATGDAGDYLFVKRQALENGASVPSYETWQKNMEQQKLNTEIAKLKLTEGIKFNYSLALEKAKNALASQGNPNYKGEFEATVKLAAAAGGTKQERDSITQNMQDFISSGDYGSAYAQILSSVQQKLKGTASTKFSEQVASKEVLADLTDAIKAYSAQGGSMNIFKGTEDEIQTKIGALVTDPQYASLAVQLDSAFQAYRQQMTGAAFGAQESAEYAKVLPGKGNTLDLNLAKLNGADTYLDSSINGTLRTTVGDGGIYIKERADAATQTVKQSAQAGDTIASFVAQSPENEQRYNELKQIAPDASPEEIMQQLGIQ